MDDIYEKIGLKISRRGNVGAIKNLIKDRKGERAAHRKDIKNAPPFVERAVRSKHVLSLPVPSGSAIPERPDQGLDTAGLAAMSLQANSNRPTTRAMVKSAGLLLGIVGLAYTATFTLLTKSQSALLPQKPVSRAREQRPDEPNP